MKDSRKIYDIGIDIIENSFDDEGEVDTEQLDALEMEFNDKAGRCVAFMKNRKYNEDTIDAIIKRLKGEIKALEQGKNRSTKERIGVGEYLKGWMIKVGLKKIESGIHRATVAKTRTAVDIISEDLVGQEFKVPETKWKISKTAIKDHFEETGEIPEGINIRHNETHLLVRYGKVQEDESIGTASSRT